jgi:hypothetical protein
MPNTAFGFLVCLFGWLVAFFLFKTVLLTLKSLNSPASTPVGLQVYATPRLVACHS